MPRPLSDGKQQVVRAMLDRGDDVHSIAARVGCAVPTVQRCLKASPRGTVKRAIAARLRRLGHDMEDLATEMQRFKGVAHWGRHSDELAGAGAIAIKWAKQIEQEAP